MVNQKKSGFDITLSVLANADMSPLIGVLGKALSRQDTALFARTTAFLAQLGDRSINRLLLRRFKSLAPAIRQILISRPSEMLAAAEELAGIVDSRIRANIVEALAALADRRSIPLMLRYLDDPSAPVRERAQYLLHVLSRRYGNQLAATSGKEREYLRTALRLVLREGEVTTDGLKTLMSLGADGFLLLVPFLRDESCESHHKITEFLRHENGAPIARCLIFLSKSNYEGLRQTARAILKERTSSPFLASVAGILVEFSEEALKPIMAMIRYLAWEDLQAEDLNRLDHPTQENLLDLVSSFGGPFSQRVSKLVPLLGSRFVGIRSEALQILSDLPSRLYCAHLPPLLNDPADAIALRATSMLNMHDNLDAFHHLIRQLSHPSALIREEAAKKLEGRTFFFIAKRWDNLTDAQRNKICRAILKVDRQFTAQVNQELHCGDPVRILRVLSIVRAMPASLSTFSGALIDLSIFPDPYIRATVASLLGHTDGSLTLQTLENLLQDSDPRVVSNSIESLAKRRAQSAVPLLRQFLGHWHNRVKSTAILALQMLGYTQLKQAVVQVAASADTRMQKSADWLLRKLRDVLNGAPGCDTFTLQATAGALPESAALSGTGG